jgi:predicted nucleic acid-binding protein
VADYFFDSSALVKAYIVETGTNWVRHILDDPQNRISICALAEVEVVSALTRRFNEGDLSQLELDQACDELRQDSATYLLVDVTTQILETAVANARNHSLRAYDAVQLAAAITVRTALLIYART